MLEPNIDQIWAEEGNVMVRFERLPNGRVNISIRDMEGSMTNGREVASATLATWRWDRAVIAMGATKYPDLPEGVPPGGDRDV